MRYANLIDKTTRMRNYGDDIQIHSIKKLYEYMGVNYDEVVRITLDELFNYNGKDYLIVPINFIFCGMHNKKISEKIIPIFLGISLLGTHEIEEFRMREFQPIGCRDQHTLELLRSNGLEAYLNGCLSLTLPKRKDDINAKKIFIVDICDELLSHVPESIKKDAEFVTHVYYNRDVSETESMAMYERYQNEAVMVITSRLHCAVPCVAYGIPVVYAPKVISTRSVWLQNIIPIYDESMYDDIDWNPQTVNIEDLKEKILQNAANRVRETYERVSLRYGISEFFEDYSYDKGMPDDLYFPITYMQENWQKEETVEYMMWGNTQTAERLYEYISMHYKNAKLVGFIDTYRHIVFHGIESEGLDLLERKKDVMVFVTPISASAVAMELFQRIGRINYVLCWENPNYKLT